MGYCISGNSPYMRNKPAKFLISSSVKLNHECKEPAHRVEVVFPSLGIYKREIGHIESSRSWVLREEEKDKGCLRS